MKLGKKNILFKRKGFLIGFIITKTLYQNSKGVYFTIKNKRQYVTAIDPTVINNWLVEYEIRER